MSGILHQLDRTVFLFINGKHDHIVDFIMYYASEKWIWIPFYVWLLYVLYRNYNKKVLWFLPVIALMITLSDQACNLVKNTVQRPRPCHAAELQGMVHLVYDKCGGAWGFISSHAANSMALTVFVWMMLPKSYTDLRRELIAYVLLIAYSRVYLGAHYPADILGGWMTGAFIGFIAAKLIQRKIDVPVLKAAGHE